MKARFVFLVLLAAIWLLFESSAFGINSVSVENVSVLAGTNNVVIHIRITNDVPLTGINVPLHIFSDDPGGATITSATMDYGDRIAGLSSATTSYQYAEQDGKICWNQLPGDPHRGFMNKKPGSGTGVKMPVAALPEGFLFTKVGLSPALQPGSDVTGSLTLTVDVGPLAGRMSIDTTCIDPANHIGFITASSQFLVPFFNYGTIIITTNVNLPGYFASSHELPDASCPTWLSQQFNGAPAPTLLGDSLRISTSSNAQNAYYVLLDPDVPTGGMTLDFRTKYVSGSTSTAEATAMVGFSRGDGWHNFLCISYDQVYLWSSEGVVGTPANVDTHNSFHTYHIEVYMAGGIAVYRDGVEIINGALIYHPAYTTRDIFFGDGASGAYGESRWTYFKLNTPTVCSCCTNKTGNVDCDPSDGVDISDLSALIDNLYISFAPLCCKSEANVDGSVDGNIDISDLSALIDYLYISFTPPAACQ
jgi:hypothetical protein